MLLTFFVYPVWDQLRGHENIRVALQGVVAVAIGIILATAVRLFLALPNVWDSYMIVMIVAVVMLSKKVPAPLLVLGVVILGFVLS